MLCLNLNQGEYVVVQLHGISGDRCKLVINAPKEIPVLRGKVLERTGGQRPECVFDGPRWHRREIIWDRSKAQALAAMRLLLSQMDGRDSNVQTLSRQLDQIFPPVQAEGTQRPAEISPG